MICEFERLCAQLAPLLRNESIKITSCQLQLLQLSSDTLESERLAGRKRSDIVVIFDHPELQDEEVAGRELRELMPFVGVKKVLYLRAPDKQKATNQLFPHAHIAVAPWHEEQPRQDEAWEKVAELIRRAVVSQGYRKPGPDTHQMKASRRMSKQREFGLAAGAVLVLGAILVLAGYATSTEPPPYELVLKEKSAFLADGTASEKLASHIGESVLCRGDSLYAKLVPAVAYQGPVLADVLIEGQKLPVEFEHTPETGTLRLRGTDIFDISPGKPLVVEIVLRTPRMFGVFSSEQRFAIKLQQSSYCR